jgi:hypothetical protein
MKQLSSEKRVMKTLCQAIIFKNVYFTRTIGADEIEESVKTPDGYVPGWVLSERNVGGSEGLRRLRDLRQKGFRISKIDVKDSTAKDRLEGPYTEVFEIFTALIELGGYPAKFNRGWQNAKKPIQDTGLDSSCNTSEISAQQKLF